MALVLAAQAPDRKSAMRDHLVKMFQAGIAACHPERVLPPQLPPRPEGRLIVLALGKAAIAMARVAEVHYGGGIEGLAVAPHGTPGRLSGIETIHAGHPIPDEASVRAAERLLALAHSAGQGDLVLVLLSGGASALACLPGRSLTLTDKQAITARLLRSGATVGEINCVRRHMSRIKGGRLPADLTLAISDVVGNRPEDIGSGPTVADPTTCEDAGLILNRHGLTTTLAETAKQARGAFRIIASAEDALRAAAVEAERLGYRPILLEECTGEARTAGEAHAAIARGLPPGSALISGGELTVTVTGKGRGGPNVEYALAASLALDGRDDIFGLAADTDGRDGTSEAAGAFIAARGDGADALQANDAASMADLFVTGPTGTNVNDLRIILVAP
jgi:glycerate 2-kinase